MKKLITALSLTALLTVATAGVPTANASEAPTQGPGPMVETPTAKRLPVVAAAAQKAKNNPCISRREFLRLKNGMTLKRTATIIGGRGRILYGDIATHIRIHFSCVAVDYERMPVCLRYMRKEKANGSFGPARLRSKNIDC